jgi:hypothetical protein
VIKAEKMQEEIAKKKDSVVDIKIQLGSRMGFVKKEKEEKEEKEKEEKEKEKEKEEKEKEKEKEKENLNFRILMTYIYFN